MPLDLSPKPVRLCIPDKCKRFIAPKWYSHIVLVSLPCLCALVLLIWDVSKAVWFALPHILPIPFGLALWLYRYRTPWYCQIDKAGLFNLIEQSRSSWQGTNFFWKESIIISMTESKWQDCPALTLRVGPKIDAEITYISDVHLVYRPEDNHKVRDLVIPAIEYYRHLHSHDEWIAQHGWEVYLKPPKVLADA